MTEKQFDFRRGWAGLARNVAAASIVTICFAVVASAVAADGSKPSPSAANIRDAIGDRVGERPGETDPINNPKRLTLFPVSTIGLLASQNSALYSDLFDYSAADAKLEQWTLTAQKLEQGDGCRNSQRRRLGHGRVSTPDFEQAVCMTNFGVTLYTSPLKINNGSHVTRAFRLPATGTAGRNFDLAVGDLSRRPGEDERPHQAIVAAYANLDQRLEIDVIEWIPTDKPDPSQGELRIVASYVGPADEVPTGDVAVTLGGYINDGTLQIVSATDVSGGPGPGSVRLAAYRYLSDGDKRTLERVGPSDVFAIPSGRPTSLTLASADFAGRGHEQLIMGYLAPGTAAGTSQFAFAYFDPAKLEHIGPPKAKFAIEPVTRESYADMAPGLFRFDPNAVAPPSVDPFFRRQLAVTYAAPEGRIFARVLQIRDDDPPAFHAGPAAQMSADNWPVATAGLGPSIAAGNFIGLKNDGVDPRSQIAVALPERGDKPGRTAPEIVVARVDGESFALDPVWRHRMPNYESSGLEFGVPILAYDRGGDSFYLGNPAHISVPDLIDPQYVVAMPPRHVDALPAPGGDPPYEIVNLLAGVGPSAFSVTLRDGADQTLTETSTNSSSSQFGGGLTQTVGGTVGLGFMNIASFETSTSVKTAVSYEQNSMERNINRSYETITTQKAATTTQDDHLVFNMRVVDVWRFPVYGLNKQRSGQFPFFDIVIPGPLTEYSGGGLNYDWYNPSHQNYNATSYPAIPKQGLFAGDIGSFSFEAEGKKVEVLHKPLNSPIVRAFDGNAQTFSLDYTKESGSGSEKSFDYSLSASLDVTVGFRASANVRMFSGSANYEGTVNLSSRSNWASGVVAERTMRNSRGITLDQPDVPGITAKAYHYQTLIYVTENGGLKVAHGADFLSSSGGAKWWKSKYGGRPDPALNLPWRMTYDSAQGSWTLTPGDDYFRLRGLKLTEAMPDKLTDEYALLSGGVDQGTKVRFVLPVHNYSLDTAAENVVVAFAYQALDPAGDKSLKLAAGGEFVEFARSKPVTIGPRGIVDVDVTWDTTGLGGTGSGTPYAFKIVVDPENKIPNKLHGSDPATGAQTVGLWPWNGGFWVFNTTDNTEAKGAQAPRLALTIENAAAHAMAAGNKNAGDKARGANADVAVVTIDMPSMDRTFRQLIISGLDRDGQRIALASRTLYGMGPGQQRVNIALGDHESVTSLQAWMSSGALRGEPREGVGATRAEPNSNGAAVRGQQ